MSAASDSIPPFPTRLFGNLAKEHGFEPAEVKGDLPPFLRGTLYRNGVGLMEQFGLRYGHLFEADGAITALRFSNDGVSVASRLVQSAGLLAERDAGRHLRSFSSSWPERMRAVHTGTFKNTANTHVIPWQDRLFALMEGGKPTEIDADTLGTIGETNLNGLIRGAFSAHPHRVASRNCTYNFGLDYGRKTKLRVYALPDEGSPSRIATIALRQPVMMHDFIATENHLVFFVCPVKLVVWRMLLALPGFASMFRWAPELGTEVIVVPIDAPEQVQRFHVDPFHVFHFANAYEEDEEIVVDYVRYDDASILHGLRDGIGLSWTDNRNLSGGRLHRARIHPDRERFESAPRWDEACEFPRIAEGQEGAKHGAIWLQSDRMLEGVARTALVRIAEDGQVTRYEAGPGELCGEPVHVQQPDAQAGAGAILSLVFDSFRESTHLLIIDAKSMKERARILMPQALPLSFHGSWISANVS